MTDATAQPSPSRRARIAWALTALLCVGVVVYASRYVLHPPASPKEALNNPLGVPWLAVHVGGGLIALLLGSLQFLPKLRLGGAHRWIGRTYVLACLVGGAAGLILAPGSWAGPIATAGFGALAVSWLATSLLGWRAARQGRFADHRQWMIRSWALTLAAVTLRIYLPLVMALHLPFPPWYRAISFLCWVPNLVVAEIYLRKTRSVAQR